MSFKDAIKYGMPQAIKLKAYMVKHHKTFCKTNCKMPGCTGFLVMRLVPRGHQYYEGSQTMHAHAYCTKCEFRMME